MTASEMTSIVSGAALNSTQTKPNLTENFYWIKKLT